jgi:nickel transport system ATP-binding protein
VPLLELVGIHKSYRRGGVLGRRERFEVLRDVHVAIEPQACVGLLGRSGSGKSTLGRIALGIEKPDSGTVLYHGKDFHSLSSKDYKDARKNLQVVFQNSLGSVNPRMTASEIVAEPLRNFENLSEKALDDRVSSLLGRVGLEPADAPKLPHQFSGGELQRVCIARAIALRPQVIILDEPVSSLDMIVQARIIDLLSNLQRELGTSYLFISHDIRVLLRMSTSLAVLHEGSIVGFARHINELKDLSHPAFKELLNAVLPPLPASADHPLSAI